MGKLHFNYDILSGLLLKGRDTSEYDGTNAYNNGEIADFIRNTLKNKTDALINKHSIGSGSKAIEFARTTGIDPASTLLTAVLPNPTIITKYKENMQALYGNTLVIGQQEDATYLTGYTIDANSLDPRAYQVSNNADYKEVNYSESTNPTKIASFGARAKTFYLERLLNSRAGINSMQVLNDIQQNVLMQAVESSMWWGGRETGNYGLMTHPEIVTSTTLGNTPLSQLNETQFVAKATAMLKETKTNLVNGSLVMYGLPTLYISDLEQLELQTKTMSIQSNATNQTYLSYLKTMFDVRATAWLNVTNNIYNTLQKEYYIVEFAKEVAHGITRQIPMMPRLAGSADTDGQVELQDMVVRSGGVVVGDKTATRIFVQQ